jgi:RNA-binding protein NOB1
MGFTLLSLDGQRVTRVKRFKLLCRACKTINLDIERRFCEKCGNSTLVKVSVYIADSGEITYFENPKRKINLRGSKFSIPKQKAGRKAKNLILREDELMMGDKVQKVRTLAKLEKKEDAQVKNTLQGNYWAGGAGYMANVSSLLYEDGARGG